MRRRTFLSSTLSSSALTVTGLLAPVGCGDSGAEDSEASFDDLEVDRQAFPQGVLSGDPRSSSVILWTRVDADGDDDVLVRVLLQAIDEDGEPLEGAVSFDATASAAFDHCVKIKVDGLVPRTRYRYAFTTDGGQGTSASTIGVTKTAPADDDGDPVTLAVVSCQDYGGRYYNSLAHLANLEVDVMLHLGDYIYETAGDESFQEGGAERAVSFDDSEGALSLGEGEDTFLAARSLDNYRQLYRTVRSDAALQRLHATTPMVAVWDDHEFSDDCHGATATYLDGREDETDVERRQNANQAWFEYMPVDYPDAGFAYDRTAMPPDDIRIYRDIRYGQHVHLVMTDLRSYRSDHLVAEDEYPGRVLLDESALGADVPEDASGYVDIDDAASSEYRDVLVAHAQAEGYDAGRITGNISAAWIDGVVEDAGAGLAPLDEDGLPIGLATHHLMKGSLNGQIGSRYLVAKNAWDRYARAQWETTGGASEVAMGDAQRGWFLDTMQATNATWKIWGNEFCLTSLDIDLRPLPIPDSFKREFHLSAEDWNGMPNRRAEVIDALSGIDNVVAVTGDIHAFFAGTPFADGAGSNKVIEFVAGSVSSAPYQTLLARQVETDPLLSTTPGAGDLANAIRDLLTVAGGPNPAMGFAEAASHGFCVLEASADELLATFHIHPGDAVFEPRYDDAGLGDLFATERFRVVSGQRELYRDFEGTWRRWDAESYAWVE